VGLYSFLEYTNYILSSAKRRFRRIARFEACGVVVRLSIFTYFYDLPLASLLLCAQI
jgi:hypothetical protein